jgi:hypothetical protein
MHKNLEIEGFEEKCSIILFKTKLVKSDLIKTTNFHKDKSKLESVLILEKSDSPAQKLLLSAK